MVRLIQAEAGLTQEETGVSEIDSRILAAMGDVPRHAFVPEPLVPYAYLPTPLPIHPEQRLAAPFLVALMTHLAHIEPGQRVLETGTGEGYHAAVLARLGAEVYSVELVPELAREATARLAGQAHANVHVREGDGYYGCREAAPFDAIIVKEAVDHVPGQLLAQLKPGGRLVLPLGSPWSYTRQPTARGVSSEGCRCASPRSRVASAPERSPPELHAQEPAILSRAAPEARCGSSRAPSPAGAAQRTALAIICLTCGSR